MYGVYIASRGLSQRASGTPTVASAVVFQQTLRGRALQLATRREYSRAELRKKLAVEAESPQQLETLLDDLVLQGFLSDARFAESRVNARTGRYGSRRIARELQEKGVPSELIAEAMAGCAVNDLSTARSLWLRKFGARPVNVRE